MRKLLFVSVVVSVFVTGCGESLVSIPKYEDRKNVKAAPAALQRAADAIVMIQVAHGGGTGSFLSTDRLLLTNNHVPGILASTCPAEGCYIAISRHRQVGTAKEAAETVFAEPLPWKSVLDPRPI